MKITRKRLSEMLIYYFSGELDRIIKRLKKKAYQEIPDEVYCTLRSIKPRYNKIGYKGIYSDPTGNKAVKIADFKLARIKHYYHYLYINQAFNEVLQALEHEEKNLIKAYINIEGFSIKKAAQGLDISYQETRRRIEKLLLLIEKDLEGKELNPMKKRKERIPHGKKKVL